MQTSLNFLQRVAAPYSALPTGSQSGGGAGGVPTVVENRNERTRRSTAAAAVTPEAAAAAYPADLAAVAFALQRAPPKD